MTYVFNTQALKNEPDRWVKPKVSQVRLWYPVAGGEYTTVHQAEELVSGTRWVDFYRLTIKGQRPKYFFGETAYNDAVRLGQDIELAETRKTRGWR